MLGALVCIGIESKPNCLGLHQNVMWKGKYGLVGG